MCSLELVCRPLQQPVGGAIGPALNIRHCYIAFRKPAKTIVFSGGPWGPSVIGVTHTGRQHGSPGKNAIDLVNEYDFGLEKRRRSEKDSSMGIVSQRCSRCDDKTLSSLLESERLIDQSRTPYVALGGPNSNSAAVFMWFRACPDPVRAQSSIASGSRLYHRFRTGNPADDFPEPKPEHIPTLTLPNGRVVVSPADGLVEIPHPRPQGR